MAAHYKSRPNVQHRTISDAPCLLDRKQQMSVDAEVFERRLHFAHIDDEVVAGLRSLWPLISKDIDEPEQQTFSNAAQLCM